MVSHCRVGLAMAVLFFAGTVFAGKRPQLPENLAPKARITASSEYSDKYVARFIANGEIPAERGNGDLGLAWAVKGDTHRNGADLTFEWDEPVTVAEIVYYGRTAFYTNECWKGCEVFLDGASEPVVKGGLKMMHGPQRIKLPKPATARRLLIRFTSSYGGHNPGASEIQVYPAALSKEQFKRLVRSAGIETGFRKKWMGTVEAAKIRSLINSLKKAHGDNYSESAEHIARLAEIEKAGQDGVDYLEELQRNVLLFDVDKVIVIRRHEILATHVYTYHYEGFKPGGALCVVSAKDLDAEPVELVTTPTGQILDCDLSYDGRTILFSWRKNKGAVYQLWTINVDGTGLKQLTDTAWHNYNGCWLPDGGIAFLCSRKPAFAYCWDAPVGVVHRMETDGTQIRCLSANYLNDFTPYPLEDGRIIYSRWEYVDKPAIPIQSLWTLNPDGTGLSGYFGNRVISPGTFMEARSIPGTNKIVCTMTGHNGPTRGAIGIIDRSKGVNAQDSIENITPDVPVPPVTRGNGNTGGTKQYSCPLPLDAIRFLVSIRGPILVRTFAGECQSCALPEPGGGMQYFNAQPVRPRPRPPVIPSSYPETTDAAMFLQDVYQGLEPKVKPGEVKQICVVQEIEKGKVANVNRRAFGFQFPVVSCGATYAPKKVLGYVPVAEDGSVCFKVPAGLPIYFMAIDAQGRAVQRMRSFTHLMPGETQGCVGCHEHRSKTAHSRARPSALGRMPLDLEPPEWGAGGFSYARIVQPVLDANCVKCHDAINPPRGIDLTGDITDFFNVSYETLARTGGPGRSPYTKWIPSFNGMEANILLVDPKTWGSPASKLANVVLSGHPDKDGKPRIDLDSNSQRRVLTWIDLNVPYYGTSLSNYYDLVGCRQMYPSGLDKELNRVAAAKCASCHMGGKIPRKFYLRITNPHLNNFMLAPVAKAQGGTGACGKAVFASKDDPDYRAILKTFEPLHQMLRQKPRMDMIGLKMPKLVEAAAP